MHLWSTWASAFLPQTLFFVRTILIKVLLRAKAQSISKLCPLTFCSICATKILQVGASGG